MLFCLLVGVQKSYDERGTMKTGFNEFRTIASPTKPHRCVWCHTEIKKFESHLQFVGHWEGEFQNWRVHIDCKKSMRETATYQDDGAICPGPHWRGETCDC